MTIRRVSSTHLRHVHNAEANKFGRQNCTYANSVRLELSRCFGRESRRPKSSAALPSGLGARRRIDFHAARSYRPKNGKRKALSKLHRNVKECAERRIPSLKDGFGSILATCCTTQEVRAWKAFLSSFPSFLPFHKLATRKRRHSRRQVSLIIRLAAG